MSSVLIPIVTGSAEASRIGHEESAIPSPPAKWANGHANGTGYSVSIPKAGGVKGGLYTFKVAKFEEPGKGNAQESMVQTCSTIGMKPVCDHKVWCKRDARATYIGQHSYFAHPRHGRVSGPANWFPWNRTEAQAHMPSHFCTFTASKTRAICTNGHSHHWKALGKTTDILCVGYANCEFLCE